MGHFMIRQLACLVGLVFILTGCLQARLVTVVDSNGEFANLVRVKTNMMSFAGIAEKLREGGVQYSRKNLPDGMVQGEWKHEFGPDEYSCHGIFLKECKLSLALPINVPDLMSQVMILDAKKKGKAKDMLSISYIVVLPEGSRVKSTDAHKTYMDEDGLNLEWHFLPDPNETLHINFIAGI